MMFNYPYIGYPFYNNYYGYFNNRNNNYLNKYNTNNYNNSNTYKDKSKLNSNNDVKNNYNNNFNKKSEEKKSNPEYIDILGIRLYFDDVLLILLIYFLYNENVKDTGLFITLILLLIG